MVHHGPPIKTAPQSRLKSQRLDAETKGWQRWDVKDDPGDVVIHYGNRRRQPLHRPSIKIFSTADATSNSWVRGGDLSWGIVFPCETTRSARFKQNIREVFEDRNEFIRMKVAFLQSQMPKKDLQQTAAVPPLSLDVWVAANVPGGTRPGSRARRLRSQPRGNAAALEMVKHPPRRG